MRSRRLAVRRVQLEHLDAREQSCLSESLCLACSCANFAQTHQLRNTAVCNRSTSVPPSFTSGTLPRVHASSPPACSAVPERSQILAPSENESGEPPVYRLPLSFLRALAFNSFARNTVLSETRIHQSPKVSLTVSPATEQDQTHVNLQIVKRSFHPRYNCAPFPAPRAASVVLLDALRHTALSSATGRQAMAAHTEFANSQRAHGG